MKLLFWFSAQKWHDLYFVILSPKMSNFLYALVIEGGDLLNQYNEQLLKIVNYIIPVQYDKEKDDWEYNKQQNDDSYDAWNFKQLLFPIPKTSPFG